MIAVAFARRTSLGDPAFEPDQEKRIKMLVSKAFAEETIQKITDVSHEIIAPTDTTIWVRS